MSHSRSHISPRPGLERLPELARALEAALLAESDALGLRDTGALLAAVDGKRRILRELADTAAGLTSGDLQASTELRQTLARCRALNDSSGSAIAALLHDTRRALGALGVSAEPASYGRSGQGLDGLPHRVIATC